MSWLFPWLMFAHVLGSIWAFGPAFAFGVYGKMAAEEKGPALAFNNRARSMVSKRMVTPGTIVVLVSGFLMIWAANLPLTHPAYRWLQVAIVIYLAMIAWNVLITVPRSRRIGELGAQAAARAAAARAASGEAAAPPAASTPASSPSVSPPSAPGQPGGGQAAVPPQGGPPPEMARLIKLVRRDGKAMAWVIVVMVFLMVVKPTFPL